MKRSPFLRYSTQMYLKYFAAPNDTQCRTDCPPFKRLSDLRKDREKIGFDSGTASLHATSLPFLAIAFLFENWDILSEDQQRETAYLNPKCNFCRWNLIIMFIATEIALG